MNIVAKFSGTCRNCGGLLPAGSTINWTRESGATHTTGYQCDVIKAEQREANLRAGVAREGAAAGQVVNATSIVDFLAIAKAHGLKYPKVRFLAPRDGELRLSVAGEKSQYPGAIQVKIDSEWIGRIGVDGRISGPLTQRPDIIAEIEAIASDPASKAKAYGALYGRCSFCGLQLTDEGSVEVGYGPICAAHYGLPHTPKGTRSVQVAV